MLQDTLRRNHLLGVGFFAFRRLSRCDHNFHLAAFLPATILSESAYCMDHRYPRGYHYHGIPLLLLGEGSSAFHVSAVSKVSHITLLMS
jgi:hypothetical protein